MGECLSSCKRSAMDAEAVSLGSHTESGDAGAASTPVLSLILCARNDLYQGNSLWRLQTALNYTGQSIQKMGRQEEVEVIVSDWGSEIPLRDVLKLTPAAARVVSFLTIPPEIARVEQKDSPFPEVLALNAAARRARGEYIGRIDQDTLVTTFFLRQFFWLHSNERLIVPLRSSLLLSNRRSIPYRIAAHCPPYASIDRYVRWFGRALPLMFPLPPHRFYISFVGIWLMHRDLWYECGGYDEFFIYMDWMEADVILRLVPKYTLVNLGELVNHELYHLDHTRVSPWEPVRAGRNRKTNPARTVEHRPQGPTNPNGADWGLTRYELENTAYPADRADAQVIEARWPPVEWAAFVGLLTLGYVQMAWDLLYFLARRVLRVLRRLAGT